MTGVMHGFSCELHDDDARAAFRTAALGDALPVARLRQVHGARVIHADHATPKAPILEGDALVTTERRLALAISTADCVPVVLADVANGVAAAVHAGWRGMRARVITATLDAMTKLGATRNQIVAGIGPSVHGRCYEVGKEVRAAFEESFPDAETLFDGGKLDLVLAAREELRRSGVDADRVDVIPRCTHCDTTLASHRRQGSERGNNLTLIALR